MSRHTTPHQTRSKPPAAIWTPGTALFDGLANVFSTCRRCRGLMVVIDPDETVHPTCEPKPTKLESLAVGLRSAVIHHDHQTARATESEINRLAAQPPELARNAVFYARIGWPVFPLRYAGCRCSGGDKCKQLGCQCPKTPATKHGFKDAATDVAAVNQFWTAHSNANIGVATGHRFDVIDVDPRSGGVASFLELLEDKRLPEIHGVAVTASGGMHCYIQPTGKSNAAGYLPGMDFRGVGGYVVAPPSTLGRPGRSWSWMVVPSPVIRGGK